MPVAPRPSITVSELERTIRREVAYARGVLRRYPTDATIARAVGRLEGPSRRRL